MTAPAPADTPPPPLYNTEEVAALFGVHRRTILEWAYLGKLGRFLRPTRATVRYYQTHVHHALNGGAFDKNGEPM